MKGLDVLVCDSTNVFEVDSSGSEAQVRQNLQKIFSEKQRGKIIITLFCVKCSKSSNHSRSIKKLKQMLFALSGDQSTE